LLLSDADLAQLPFDWIPEKWERCVLPDGCSARLLHRKYLELCVFRQVMHELNSGDIYVEGSDHYDDPREHQISLGTNSGKSYRATAKSLTTRLTGMPSPKN